MTVKVGHTYDEKYPRKCRTKVSYKGTFVSEQSLINFCNPISERLLPHCVYAVYTRVAHAVSSQALLDLVILQQHWCQICSRS